MRYKLLFPILLLFIIKLFPSITITPNQYEFVTGDKLSLKMELTYPSEAVIDLSSIKNYSTDEFELIEFQPKLKTELDGIVTETIINEYLVFGEKGEQNFGPINFSYVINEEIKNFSSDSIKIVIHSILQGNVSYIDSTGKQNTMPLDSLKMVLPIKDIGEYKLSVTEKKYIISFIVLLIVIAILIYFFIKRKKNGAVQLEIKEKVVIIPAHIKAFEKLDELKKKNYLSKGNFKEFAAELSLITRLFIEDRYLFPGAELPTGELKKEIVKFIEKNELLQGMHKLLEITDYVKFAKFIPMEAELKGFLDFAYELVDKLKEESKRNNV
ncbi:MAG: hypothetical protein PF574_00905 [Candidatus Delongbacteria bacterium]|jgi:hypothetical protein|nr:hypothetical protein [Candidatus Delongbacteria bacterium]